MPTVYEFSPHDICLHLFVPLNCDGTVASQTDNYTINTAVGPGAATEIVVNETIDLDTTPPYGELVIDVGGTPETVGYGSITAPSTFNLITGTTLTGTYTGGETADVDRAEPIVHCSLTQVRLPPLVTDEVIDTDPGSQANQNVAYRRIAPQANGYRFEADISSRENPRLWSLTDQYAPVMNPAVENEVLGFEEPVTTASTCPTCGAAAGTCHSLAYIAVANAICGEERLANIPYVALICRSLRFEPTVENLVWGRGFNAGRVMRAELRRNSSFVDPWGFDPRGAGQLSRWSVIPILQTAIDADADLDNLLTNGCGCGSCPNPTVAWPAA